MPRSQTPKPEAVAVAWAAARVEPLPAVGWAEVVAAVAWAAVPAAEAACEPVAVEGWEAAVAGWAAAVSAGPAQEPARPIS
jgi:hypothetical protein